MRLFHLTSKSGKYYSTESGRYSHDVPDHHIYDAEHDPLSIAHGKVDEFMERVKSHGFLGAKYNKGRLVCLS